MKLPGQLRTLLDEHGIAVLGVRQGKHLVIHLARGEDRGTLTVSRTGSDWRMWRNVKRDLRKLFCL